MFTIVKTSYTPTVTVSTNPQLTKHQFIIIPSSDATMGLFHLYSLVAEEYVEFKDEALLFEELQPIIIEGRFTGFKIFCEAYDGTTLKLEYTGE